MECLVKICGITSERDLKAAQDLGADFVGFVLEEKSKRYISLKRLEQLSTNIRKPLKSVALVVDPSDNFLGDVAYEFQSRLYTVAWKIPRESKTDSKENKSSFDKSYWS